MKKPHDSNPIWSRKLALHRETLRRLDPAELRSIRGGGYTSDEVSQSEPIMQGTCTFGCNP